MERLLQVLVNCSFDGLDLENPLDLTSILDKIAGRPNHRSHDYCQNIPVSPFVRIYHSPSKTISGKSIAGNLVTEQYYLKITGLVRP